MTRRALALGALAAVIAGGLLHLVGHGSAGNAVWAASVARYVFDLGDWEQSAWIVPLGASGHAGSPHYADQATPWAEGCLRPMRYDWGRVRREAEGHQRLDPS